MTNTRNLSPVTVAAHASVYDTRPLPWRRGRTGAACSAW